MTEAPEAPAWAARILVADDDPAMRSFVADVLRDEGCAVIHACDGAEAAQRMCVEAQPWEYELVITDYRMPSFNGLDLAWALRGRNGPPIVLMSAFLDDALAAKATAAGVAAVLSKPFAVNQLLAIVRGLIGPL